MSRELLKRALDALEDANHSRDGEQDYDLQRSVREAIETYLAQPEEPVAWMIENHPTESTFANFKDNFNSHFEHIGCKVTPLYTTPPDQSARVAELEGHLEAAEQHIKILMDQLQRLSDECGIEAAHGIAGGVEI